MLTMAMDHDEGQLFRWNNDVYKVVKPVKDSSERLIVLRVATFINGKCYQVASTKPLEENFNTMCPVQSGTLELLWCPTPD